MMWRVSFAAVLATLLAITLFTLPALAQYNGRIEGTITDKSGARGAMMKVGFHAA